MGKTLIIAEKPSVAADIARVLGVKSKGDHAWEGGEHVVSWAIGHLLEFVPPEAYDEKWKRWRLADLPILPEKFIHVPDKDGKKQLGALKKLLTAKDVDQVINACDAGREGELIFQEIYRYSGCKAPVARLWLQSMTTDAIRSALRSPRRPEEVQGLADAADCRAESDWLIGMNATRALTVRLRSQRDKAVWSAGRVQTATLAILVRKEREILAHEPRPYWVVEGRFHASRVKAHDYTGAWYDPQAKGDKDRIWTEAELNDLLARLRAATSATATESRKDSSEAAPPLFDLTSLQREGNRRFGFPARRTLQAAQALYEQYKLITYPRTDSRALPSDYRGPVQKSLEFLGRFPDYAPHANHLIEHGLQNQKRNFNDAEISDHFAIIPTGEGDPSRLRPEEEKIWDLVVRRFLAAFHPPAVHAEVDRTTVVVGEQFRTRRRVLKIPGWRGVYEKEAVDDRSTLPPLPDGAPEPVRVEEWSHEEKETRPPSRLTEATLLSLMETAGKEVDDEKLAQVLKDTGGLGTPATRAEIIETLIDRDYVQRCSALDGKKALRATARGIWLIDVLERVGVPITSAELTAQWEDSLREMEHDRRSRAQYMKMMRATTSDLVDRVRGFTFDGLFQAEEDLGKCPLCGAAVRETLRTWSCIHGGKEGTCAFVMWKEVAGRYLDRASAAQLLHHGQTAPKAGFVSQQGREYEGVMRLGPERRVEVVARGQADQPVALASEVVEEDVCRCPDHPDELVRRTASGFRCALAGERKCKVTFPLLLCQRPFANEEIVALLGADAKTPLLAGFTSKRGRPFSAVLHREGPGKLRWEFPPREKGAGKAKASTAKVYPVDPRPIAPCPKHPQEQVRETEVDYACPYNGCAVKLPRELCSRPISRDEAAALLTKKVTPVLEGFISKAGKPFSATLTMKRIGKVGFQFEDR